MFINIEELLQLQEAKEDYIIIEATMTEAIDPFTEEDVYNKGHIENALFINGNDIYLKDRDQLKNFYESYGISTGSKVILYDEVNLGGPSRAYIDLKNLGLENVFILNGGTQAYKEAGGKLEEKTNKSSIKGDILVKNKPYIEIVDYEYVKSKLNNQSTTIIDGRRKKAYEDGHIDGAINISFEKVRNENNSFKSQEQIEEVFKDMDQTKEIIVYCNFSFLASVIALALKISGYNPKIYGGSYNEWKGKYNK